MNLNNSVYTKSLGEPYVTFTKKKIKSIFKKHKKNYIMDFEKVDYNKLLIHHSYNINTSHQPKLMNYVSLYGFLRVISLVFNLLSIFMFLKIFFFDQKLNLNNKFSADSIVFFISSFLTYITYLGYLKFYRRYTHENLMILLLK